MQRKTRVLGTWHDAMLTILTFRPARATLTETDASLLQMPPKLSNLTLRMSINCKVSPNQGSRGVG